MGKIEWKEVPCNILDSLPKGSLTGGDRVILYTLAKDKEVVEIGTACGMSAIVMANVAIHVTTIDIFGIRDYTDIDSAYEDVKKSLSVYENIKVIKNNSVLECNNFKNKSCDMVFIDGNHSFEAVTADFYAWLPKVKDNGIILFHDYSDIHPTSKQAIDRLYEDNKGILKDLNIDLEMENVMKGFKIDRG